MNEVMAKLSNYLNCNGSMSSKELFRIPILYIMIPNYLILFLCLILVKSDFVFSCITFALGIKILAELFVLSPIIYKLSVKRKEQFNKVSENK